MKSFDERVDELVDTLGCSIKEAEDILRADEQIDKGEKLFEQSQEQKQASKKYRQGDRKPTIYKLDKRERKADNEKRQMVELLASAVGMVADGEPTITNQERQIDFELKGRKMRIVLSCPRT